MVIQLRRMTFFIWRFYIYPVPSDADIATVVLWPSAAWFTFRVAPSIGTWTIAIAWTSCDDWLFPNITVMLYDPAWE